MQGEKSPIASAAPLKGVSLDGIADMKFVLDGRSCLEGAEWTLPRHGFTFLTGKETSLSVEDFLRLEPQFEPDIIKFSGPSPVNAARPSNATSMYNMEIAELCKSLVPEAEAVVVQYNVLRKSDLKMGSEKYARPPKQTNSEAHSIASKIVGGLNLIEFTSVADQHKYLALLKQKTDSSTREFLQDIIETSHKSATPEIKLEVMALLSGQYYNFLAQAEEALTSCQHLTPQNPESKAHCVVSQVMCSFHHHLAYFPAEYKERVADQLHCQGPQGVDSFIQELVAGHSMPLQANQYALMPEASQTLQTEVTSLMRDEFEYYNFIERVRSLIPKPGEADSIDGSGSLNDVAFQPPALGGGHTDVSAQGFLSQFRSAIPEHHDLSMLTAGHKRRVMYLKFWRSIAHSPVENHHLAMLDKGSIEDSEIYEYDLNFKGMLIKQNRLKSCVNADKLRWVYFPRMQRDEVICFQQGDMTIHTSLGDGVHQRTTFPQLQPDHSTFHGAFEDPTAPVGTAPRQSVEVAAFVLLPEELDVQAKL